MNIKTAIRLIAVGFIFTLVNVNVTIGTSQINFTPDFIGWILICYACTKLGDYIKGKAYFTIGAILLAIIDIAILVVGIFFPKFDLTWYTSGASLLSVIYIFLLLGLLEKIGKDKKYSDTASIRILKYVYLTVFCIFQALAFASDLIPIEILKVLIGISGGAALITALITAYVLVKMSLLID